MKDSDLDFETVAAHAGLHARIGETVSTVAPIVASTTFTGESIHDVHAALASDEAGFAYARNANPTVRSLELSIASLEGAEDAVAFGSGMGAIQAALAALALSPGDVIVAAGDLYGVTRSAFAHLLNFDVQTRYVDIHNHDEVDAAVAAPEVRALFFEGVSNPLVRVADVARLSDMGRRRKRTVIMDNTFATPYLLAPLRYGVDMVVHSATKYLAGHGDVTAGLVAANRSWATRVRNARTVTGSVLSPFEAWLTLRGIRTLPLRMDRQCASAMTVASWLSTQDWVEAVHYPGLESSPYRGLAEAQFGGRFGAVVAFDLRADEAQTLSFIDGLRLVTCGTSLGDVQTLALYPPLSSHRTLSPDELARSGIGPGLIRLSIGLESPRDLIEDMRQSAEALGLTSGTAAATR